MIDLHCHILPGIDDGPRDEAKSLALARSLVGQGVRTVAATPHLRADHPRAVPAELARLCAELRSALEAEEIPLEVVSGGEVDLLWAHSASPEELRLASFAQRGTDLLLETPYGPLPPNFEDLVFDGALGAFRLLLAHPERNLTLQQHPRRIADLVRRGALLQVTASSLTRRRSRSGALARALVEEGLVHVIASDAHDAAQPDRAGLREGVHAASKLAPARTDWMVNEAPRAILEGRALPSPPTDRQRVLRRLRRRFPRQ